VRPGVRRRERTKLLVFFIGLYALSSCQRIFGIEEATLVCPPGTPNCKLCDEPSDCGSPTECHAWACVDHQCSVVNMPVQTKCSQGVCSEDPVSVCVECVKYADCPGGHCRDHVCSRCDDGIKNGFEEEIDCGGGGGCKECLGTPCANPDDCQSGYCVDGTCCTSACEGACSFCGFPYMGSCSSLPKYSHDQDPMCNGNYVCDGGGTCLLRPGEVCTSAIECASYRCEASRCRKLAGESCQDFWECVDDLCVAGKCQN
jgi:hypothetical protein